MLWERGQFKKWFLHIYLGKKVKKIESREKPGIREIKLKVYFFYLIGKMYYSSVSYSRDSFSKELRLDVAQCLVESCGRLKEGHG